MSVELPFTLTHPKPETPVETNKNEQNPTNGTTNNQAKNGDAARNGGSDQTVPVDLNLIEFETKYDFYFF